MWDSRFCKCIPLCIVSFRIPELSFLWDGILTSDYSVFCRSPGNVWSGSRPSLDIYTGMDGPSLCTNLFPLLFFTVVYSFLGQLFTSLITNKTHMFFCVKEDKGYCVVYNTIDWLFHLLYTYFE